MLGLYDVGGAFDYRGVKTTIISNNILMLDDLTKITIKRDGDGWMIQEYTGKTKENPYSYYKYHYAFSTRKGMNKAITQMKRMIKESKA